METNLREHSHIWPSPEQWSFPHLSVLLNLVSILLALAENAVAGSGQNCLTTCTLDLHLHSASIYMSLTSLDRCNSSSASSVDLLGFCRWCWRQSWLSDYLHIWPLPAQELTPNYTSPLCIPEACHPPPHILWMCWSPTASNKGKPNWPLNIPDLHLHKDSPLCPPESCRPPSHLLWTCWGLAASSKGKPSWPLNTPALHLHKDSPLCPPESCQPPSHLLCEHGVWLPAVKANLTDHLQHLPSTCTRTHLSVLLNLAILLLNFCEHVGVWLPVVKANLTDHLLHLHKDSPLCIHESCQHPPPPLWTCWGPADNDYLHIWPSPAQALTPTFPWPLCTPASCFCPLHFPCICWDATGSAGDRSNHMTSSYLIIVCTMTCPSPVCIPESCLHPPRPPWTCWGPARNCIQTQLREQLLTHLTFTCTRTHLSVLLNLVSILLALRGHVGVLQVVLEVVPADHLDAGHNAQLSQEHAQFLLLVHCVVCACIHGEKHAQCGVRSPAWHHVQDTGNLKEEKTPLQWWWILICCLIDQCPETICINQDILETI